MIKVVQVEMIKIEIILNNYTNFCIKTKLLTYPLHTELYYSNN